MNGNKNRNFERKALGLMENYVFNYYFKTNNFKTIDKIIREKRLKKISIKTFLNIKCRYNVICLLFLSCKNVFLQT